MSHTLFFMVVASCVLLQSLDASGHSSWNSLLMADGIFPLTSGQTSHNDSTVMGPPMGGSDGVVSQLQTYLSDPTRLTQLYKNFQHKFKHDGPSMVRGSRRIFKKRLVQIARHNLDFEAGKVTWQMGVTPFTDMTEDMMASFTGFVPPANISFGEEAEAFFAPRQLAPVSLDLRNYGIISPIKNQGGCGSCTLFSIISLLEAAVARKNGGILLDLSEQQLVDCSRAYNGVGQGCNGNWYEPILNYAKSNWITMETQYPYQAMNSMCKAAGKTPAALVTSYVSAPRNEDGWKQILTDHGPLGVVVSVDNGWFNYRGGRYSCTGSNGLHAVNVVGYGSDGTGDYWIIKNSWGTHWGESGYMKLTRGTNNCGINVYNAFYVSDAAKL